MTIHIIGSSGFIGKSVIREAISRNIDYKQWSHSSCDKKDYFNLLETDSWSLLMNSQPSTAILLSWPGLPNYSKAFHLNQNLPACMHLIDSLYKVGLKKLVVAGTCYEYGLQNGALKEDQLTDPINAYSIAKDSLRRYIFNNKTYSSLSCCWARIFYPYGLGQNPNSLLPSLQRLSWPVATNFLSVLADKFGILYPFIKLLAIFLRLPSTKPPLEFLISAQELPVQF